MIFRFVVNILVLVSVLPICSYASSEYDEGGIVGTGRTSSLERPEVMHRPELPERIEPADVEVNERPDLSGDLNFSSDVPPPAVESVTPPAVGN